MVLSREKWYHKTTMFLTPTQLKELCAQYSLSPSREYGQNYLISDKPIVAMLEAAALTSSDTVFEVGPGFGVLTFALLERAKKVVAFEIEKKLLPYWEEKERNFPHLRMVWGNVLFKLEEETKKEGKYKIIANLPYQITSHFLRTVFSLENKPEQVLLMVQKEVGERMQAKPGDMSLLSLSVQYYGKVKIIEKVPAGSFWPVPKVDSCVVEIRDIEGGDSEKEKLFFRLAKAGFQNKRKQLWKNISVGLHLAPDEIKQRVEEICGNEKVRAEELSMENWKQLTLSLKELL